MSNWIPVEPDPREKERSKGGHMIVFASPYDLPSTWPMSHFHLDERMTTWFSDWAKTAAGCTALK
jgi:hypothetical protein